VSELRTSIDNGNALGKVFDASGFPWADDCTCAAVVDSGIRMELPAGPNKLSSVDEETCAIEPGPAVDNGNTAEYPAEMTERPKLDD
jgi:hypothetical protein